MVPEQGVSNYKNCIMTHSSVGRAGVGINDESIPDFYCSLSGQVEGTILQQERHELEV